MCSAPRMDVSSKQIEICISVGSLNSPVMRGSVTPCDRRDGMEAARLLREEVSYSEPLQQPKWNNTGAQESSLSEVTSSSCQPRKLPPRTGARDLLSQTKSFPRPPGPRHWKGDPSQPTAPAKGWHHPKESLGKPKCHQLTSSNKVSRRVSRFLLRRACWKR